MHFGFIPQKIMLSEKQNVLLACSISSFEEVVLKISEVPRNKERTINNKLKTVLETNAIYKSLKNIKNIITGTRESILSTDQNIIVTNITYF